MTLPGLPASAISKVDCGTCRKCCKGNQLILLVEGDDPRQYDCYEIAPDQWAVKRKPNGDCTYLGENGCTIYGRHPSVCKVFSCIEFVRRLDQGAYDGLGQGLDNRVVKEGRKRLTRAVQS